MLTELDALRLSIFGWDILLTWLFCSRLADRRMGRTMIVGYKKVRALPAPVLLYLIGITVVVQMFRWTPIVLALAGFVEKPIYPPMMLITSITCQHAAIAMLITAISYDPRWKAKWMIGWSILAHVAVWGSVLWK